MFALRHAGLLNLPKVVLMNAMITAEEVKTVTFDMQVKDLVDFLKLSQADFMTGISYRSHRRSPTSTKEVPRVAVDVTLCAHISDLERLAVLKRLRREYLPADTFYGFRSMSTAKDALILECGSISTFRHYWPLCSQLLVISPTRFLVFTETDMAVWTEVLDRVYREDPQAGASRLRCRPSHHGGRTLATPAATSTQLGANKRRSNKRASPSDKVATIVPQGDLGLGDEIILDKLMKHVCDSTGLVFKKAEDNSKPKAGEYYHVPTADARVHAGLLKVLGRTQEDIRKLYAALHGQAIQAGQDYIVIEVKNDLVELQVQQGNDPRGW